MSGASGPWDLWRVIHEGSVRVRPVFAWFDFWIGVYIDRAAPAVYFFPVPMLGVRIYWPELEEYYRLDDPEQVRLEK